MEAVMSGLSRLLMRWCSGFAMLAGALALPLSAARADDAGSLEVAVGFVKRPDGLVGSMNHDSSFAWLSVWGPTTRSTGGHGDLGGGLIKLSDAPLDVREMADHFVALFDATPGETLTHYVGAGWTPSGQFDSVEDWWAHLNDFGARLATPVRITFVD